MSLTAIIILISIGLVLILIEFLVLPGTNVAGILGILMIIGGILFAYRNLGTPIANYVLFGSLVLMISAIVIMLRSQTWKKIALNTSIESKVENVDKQFVKVGDIGESVTRIAPVGTVLVNNKTFEGESGHQFIDPNTPIEVIDIKGNQLIVKQIQ